jgi:hypothetical protein
MTLQPSGHVLGIDVGFSTKSKTSAACKLSWQNERFDWNIERFRYDPHERSDTIARVVGGKPLSAVALDGPIRGDLQEIGIYRVAEKMLTVGLQPHIGKPGQSSAPVGRRLNIATNEATRCVLALDLLDNASHVKRIHLKAVVEAFPSSFMGLLIPNAAELNGKREKKSDRYFEWIASTGGFDKLLKHLAPQASFTRDPNSITNHDDRAAFVCALTALCVVAHKYSAVGDENGWIILPPIALIAPQFLQILERNFNLVGNYSFFS